MENVAQDTCLYSERFAFKVVNTTGSLSATNKVAVDAALSYYFGTDGNMTAEQVASQVCRQTAHLCRKIRSLTPYPIDSLDPRP